MSQQIITRRENNVLSIVLSHPAKLNALTAAMWRQLHRELVTAASDEKLLAVIVRGDGKQAFCAGADIAEFGALRETAENALAYHSEAVAPVLQALAALPMPSIAAITGVCMGGGLEIALSCDIRLAADNALFGIRIARMGFPMYPPELELLLQSVNPAVVAELLFEAKTFAAEEARQKQLVQQIYPAAEFDHELGLHIERILSGSRQVARTHKYWLQRLRAGQSMREEEKLASFTYLSSADYQEGLSAFFAGRVANFNG